MGTWTTDPATGNQTWQGSQYLPNGGPVYAWGDLIDPNNPDGGRYAMDTAPVAMQGGLPSYATIGIGDKTYYAGNDGYFYYKPNELVYNSDGIPVAGPSFDFNKRYSRDYLLSQPGALTPTVYPDYTKASGGMDLGMLAAFAGIGGLGLSGLLEGLGGATAASAPAAEGLSWLGNAGLSSIPEAVASLPAAASAGAGASWLGNDGLSSIADAVGSFDPAAASGALETGAGTGIDIAADAAANVDPVWGQNLTPSDWTNYYDDWGVGTNAAGDIVNAQGQRAWQDVMAETLRDIGLPRDMAAKAVTSLSSLSPTDLKKALSAVTGGSGSGASGANSSATAGGVSGLLPIPIGQNKSIIEAMMSGGNNNSLDAFLAYMAQSGKGR